jgi:phospholipase/carboxylesterase
MVNADELLHCLEIGPAEQASGSVIWMHGLGANSHDFADVPPLLGLPQVRFIFPDAPRRAITVNMGLIMQAWYDLRGLGGERDEDEAGIRASLRHIEALIARENERGVPSTRIVLAGFSQGGAMALLAGTRHAQTLGGILVLSGYELLAGTRATESHAANQRTPLLVCHGRFDPMVPFEAGRLAHAAHAHEQRESRFLAYDMAHQVCAQELHDIRAWLHARLGAGNAPA